jgi:hypothetical protein
MHCHSVVIDGCILTHSEPLPAAGDAACPAGHAMPLIVPASSATGQVEVPGQSQESLSEELAALEDLILGHNDQEPSAFGTSPWHDDDQPAGADAALAIQIESTPSTDYELAITDPAASVDLLDIDHPISLEGTASTIDETSEIQAAVTDWPVAESIEADPCDLDHDCDTGQADELAILATTSHNECGLGVYLHDDSDSGPTFAGPAASDPMADDSPDELRLNLEAMIELANELVADEPAESADAVHEFPGNSIEAEQDATTVGSDRSVAETLRTLETLRPFDAGFEPIAPMPDLDCSVCQPNSGALPVSGPCEQVCENSLQPVASGSEVKSGGERPSFRAGSLRITRFCGPVLQSSVPQAAAAIQSEPSSWAADLLAISGLLILAASVLYIAADALLCF